MTHNSPNLAQIPKVRKGKDNKILKGLEGFYGYECRKCWVAPEGYVLVGCDASGLELRMLCHYMRDEDYTRVVIFGLQEEGTDIHTVNMKAAGLLTRDQAKTFIYAFLYGAGPAKIGKIVGGTAKDGKKLIDKFLQNTPSLQKLRAKLEKYVKNGYVPGLDGRLIWVRSDHAALNTLLQGAGAIIMKKALCILDKKIRTNKWDAHFVVNVHDEFQLEVKEEHAEEVGKAAKQSIIEAGEYFNLRCPLDGEYKIGKNWAETH
jgi:DNA polymerase I-like protein with 3'-5' exonuclease and polymerase domains